MATRDDLGAQITAQLIQIRSRNGGKLGFEDIGNAMLKMLDSIGESHIENQVFAEIMDIRNSIGQVKDETVNILHAEDDNSIPDATDHLDAVIKETEHAANAIIDSASAIQELTDSSDNQEIRDKCAELVTKIYEACNFQDISSQRIRKVFAHLTTIEKRLDKLVKALGGQTGNAAAPKAKKIDPDKGLLDGPQLSSSKPSQSDIDDLFASL